MAIQSSITGLPLPTVEYSDGTRSDESSRGRKGQPVTLDEYGMPVRPDRLVRVQATTRSWITGKPMPIGSTTYRAPRGRPGTPVRGQGQRGPMQPAPRKPNVGEFGLTPVQMRTLMQNSTNLDGTLQDIALAKGLGRSPAQIFQYVSARQLEAAKRRDEEDEQEGDGVTQSVAQDAGRMGDGGS